MTSATGGYLTPTIPLLPGDLTLNQFIQQAFVGMTGFAGINVRPKWQKNPPKQLPNPEDNYLMFGVTKNTPDDNAEVEVLDDGLSSNLVRYEELSILCSFYGNNCQQNAGVLRDAFQIAQNRDVLSTGGIKFKGAGETIFVPELHGQAWFPRCDITINLVMKVVKNYEILSISGFEGSLEGLKNNDEVETVELEVTEII